MAGQKYRMDSAREAKNEKGDTSDKDVWVLVSVLELRDDSIDDLIGFEELEDVLELEAGDAFYFWLDVVDVLDDVGHEHLEVLLVHGLAQQLRLGNELVPDSPGELVGNHVEVGLQVG
jgi:hypothetical protein